MIAFWESESEGRKVFYHSITREDSGEDVLTLSAGINVAYLGLQNLQARAATLSLTLTAQLSL
jgi:hypothetical protein